MSFMTKRGAMPPEGFLPGSLKHLKSKENKAKYDEALKLYKETAELVHDLLDEAAMERRVEGVFDKLLPGARHPRSALTRGAIEIVIAVGDADPQWPHVDVLTVGKLQVLVYLNGVQVATQLARYAGDPVQWAEQAFAADSHGDGIAPFHFLRKEYIPERSDEPVSPMFHSTVPTSSKAFSKVLTFGPAFVRPARGLPRFTWGSFVVWLLEVASYCFSCGACIMVLLVTDAYWLPMISSPALQSIPLVRASANTRPAMTAHGR
jgi:hypothetical protein